MALPWALLALAPRDTRLSVRQCLACLNVSLHEMHLAINRRILPAASVLNRCFLSTPPGQYGFLVRSDVTRAVNLLVQGGPRPPETYPFGL